jgi:hypothetical protein
MNFVRADALPHGLLPVRPEEHGQDTLVRILKHLKSLETKETYERGLVYTEPGTGTALYYDMKDKEGNIGLCFPFRHMHVTQIFLEQSLQRQMDLTTLATP